MKSPPSFWTSPLLAGEPRLVHGVTQDAGNMALTVGPDQAGTVDRRRRVCEALSLPFERLTLGRQVHGTAVAVVTGDRIGCGRENSTTRIADVDGLMTDQPDVPLMVLSADCCLMVVYDPRRPALGVGHAGWRGTAAGMARNLVKTMVDSFGCQPEALLAALSPCAGVCCYAVGTDVEEAFEEHGRASRPWHPERGHVTSTIRQRRGSAMYLDLAQANRLQLQSCGLGADRVDVAGVCTICCDTYFSYRRDGESAGQFALIAALS
ncbi:MAG: polyphenol oxidase family protein [Phycisphaerae bacterium]